MMDRNKYIELFSKERIDSYQSIEEHDENLRFIVSITKDLAIIELVFRNRINKIMIEKYDQNWIKKLKNELQDKEKLLNQLEHFLYIELEKELNKDENKLASNEQITSRMMFGFWINMLFYIIDNKISAIMNIGDFSKVKLRKYSYKNRNIDDSSLKAKIVLRLIQKIRNRAFHWENLLKNGSNRQKGKQIPNIYININQRYYAGVFSARIKDLIEDTIECFEKELRKI